MYLSNEDKQIELLRKWMLWNKSSTHLKRTLEKREQDAKLAEQRKNDVFMLLGADIKTPITSLSVI